MPIACFWLVKGSLESYEPVSPYRTKDEADSAAGRLNAGRLVPRFCVIEGTCDPVMHPSVMER